ncbi:Ubiquitin-conjugating enzyme [Drechslerella dactyloides]|uniref:Ubiquitin-conjugating enzyme E2 1 n=1 Tax=Drechslerella dactyloides TaxID=74499 RepID=A0AAD6NME3_DREDA|nr:Ubiquitin-conjugating enzyme [Drechslerella dactyloides]
MANRSRRINKEMDDLRKDALSGMKAEPVNDDISHLRGVFKGPPGTPYEGGEFTVDIKIPAEYPFKPPQMRFETKVWHPNVSSQTGAICLDTLSAAWSPVLTIKSAMLSLQSLLATPEPKDPQDAEVAGMLLRDKPLFEKTAREWAVRYAGAPQSVASSSSSAVRDPRAAREAEARQRAEEERIRQQQYDGYPPGIFADFSAMGFDVPRVVRALKAMGIPRGVGRLPAEVSEEIVERLLSQPA